MTEDFVLHEQALEIWGAARATLESGDRSDLARLQIEEAFALYEQRIAALERELGSVRMALRLAARTFREYEQLHLAKGTHDGRLKANANANIATVCEIALSPSSSELAGDDLEEKP